MEITNEQTCIICYENDATQQIFNLSCCSGKLCEPCYNQLNHYSAPNGDKIIRKCPQCRGGARLINPAENMIKSIKKIFDTKPSGNTNYDEVVENYAEKQSSKQYSGCNLVHIKGDKKTSSVHLGATKMGELTYCPPPERKLNRYSDFVICDKNNKGIFYNKIEKNIDGETYFKMEYVGKNWTDCLNYIDRWGTKREYKFMKTFDYVVFDDRENYYETKYDDKWRGLFLGYLSINPDPEPEPEPDSSSDSDSDSNTEPELSPPPARKLTIVKKRGRPPKK